MNILVNGKAREVSSNVLSDVLQELGYGDATIATALNGQFVAIAARGATRVSDCDTLEVVAPMQGG